nr:bromodomain adjacent to zinc finger domain protein 1A isoform X1 [Ciona intestinalis]|eukprot:XP_002126456.1 bromodomain adjacent to zinc finger domain protein 1A isoform X1 [Ciona intestinalis]
MPLLHRKRFVPKLPPENLNPEDEVFYCPLTHEIFFDYDEFYDRTILCNSLVWSCSITDRPNLTFQEALDSEKAAKKKLAHFPISIQKPLLYLVSIAGRSRIDELSDVIYSFMKDRYFVGELVEVLFETKATKRSTCCVTRIVPPVQTNGHLNGGLVDVEDGSSGDEDDLPLADFKKTQPIPGNEVQYLVRKLRVSGETEKVVFGGAIRRKAGLFNRQICKLFLKANCIKPNGQTTDEYVVLPKVSAQLKIDLLEWETIFVGLKPNFASFSPKSNKSKKVGNGTGKSRSDNYENGSLQKLKGTKQLKENVKNEKKKEKEENKKKRLEQFERMKEVARLDKEKRKKEREEEQHKLKMERETIKHQKQEEKKRLANYLKEWSRPREDLECDDLKDLPDPQPISCELPPSLFGDALSLLEFFHVFGNLFDAKDEFPNGVTLDLLSKALLQKDPDGPLCDLFFFFLSNLFRTHTEEEGGYNKVYMEPGDKELATQPNEQLTEEVLLASASLSATWPFSYQGFPLSKLELDSYTVTEVLRIYLISSSCRPRPEDRVWRYQHRGSYTVFDDTPLKLCFDQPKLVQKLSKLSIYDFQPDEKLSLLMCLLHQLLSYVTPRDFLEETWDHLQQAKQAFRDDRWAEKRREKEAIADRVRWKGEQNMLEKQARQKELEEKLRRAELGLPEPDLAVQRNLRKRKDEIDDSEPRLLSLEEKEERLRAFDEEETIAKDAWKFRLQKHQQTVAKYQAPFQTMALGQDRYYRRYWNVSSAPGILVEEFPDPALTDDVLTIKVEQKSGTSFQMTPYSGRSTPGLGESSAGGTPINIMSRSHVSTSSQQNTPNVASPLAIGQKTQQTVVHQGNGNVKTASIFSPVERTASPVLRQCINNNVKDNAPIPMQMDESELELPTQCSASQGKESRWYIYSSPEEIESLLSSLNTRGFRESQLLNRVNQEKDTIIKRLTKHPGLLDIDQLLTNPDPHTSNKQLDCEKTLELLLRDQILELEARMWGGTLGVTKVGDRPAWRDSIANCTKYEGSILCDVDIHTIQDENLIEDKKEESKSKIFCDPVIQFPWKQQESETEVMVDQDDSEENETSVVKELATNLLIIARSVDKKYLKAPLGKLGEAKAPRSKNSDDKEESDQSEMLLRRWELSLLHSTSLSQVFLHLSTLDRCIMWTKSILNTKCRICRRKGDGEKMLLCDNCDRGHHMYCLRPALKIVPSGDWFCPDCKPRQSRISPRKVVRTKSFSQVSAVGADLACQLILDESSDDEESEEEESEEDVESSEEEVPVKVPAKKNLTYKIPKRPQKKGVKSTGKAKAVETKTEKTKVKEEELRSGSKRRSTGVWKELSVCAEILSELIKHKESWPFLDPVSKKQVPDYYDIIKKPMDLGTIHRKLKNVQYQSPSDFIADVDQIFLNCHEYNEARSVVARSATHLQIYFDGKLQASSLIHHRTSHNPSKRKKTG